MNIDRKAITRVALAVSVLGYTAFGEKVQSPQPTLGSDYRDKNGQVQIYLSPLAPNIPIYEEPFDRRFDGIPFGAPIIAVSPTARICAAYDGYLICSQGLPLPSGVSAVNLADGKQPYYGNKAMRFPVEEFKSKGVTGLRVWTALQGGGAVVAVTRMGDPSEQEEAYVIPLGTAVEGPIL